VVGSIKTVVGHTEGTAGMAGMLKALLAIRHRVIPPNLHFNNLNPSVAPFYDRLTIPTEPIPWPAVAPGMPLRASVNSFGFGGTNAHAIMESYVPENHTLASNQGDGVVLPLVLSAHSEKALISVVENYATFLRKSQETTSLRDLAWTLHSRRSNLPVKVAFSGLSTSDLAQQMQDKLESVRNTPGSELGTHSPAIARQKPSLLGVFTGQGAQWPTMGKHLIDNSRAFRDTIERLEKSLAELDDGPDWSLKHEILSPKAKSRVAEAALSQPLCTAIAIALVDLLHASGVSFSAVVGHSSGEIGAAYAAGVVTAEEAMKIAYYRGKYAKLAEGKNGAKGGMLAVGMGFDEAKDFCDQPAFKSRLGVAASNSPTSVTLSGDLDAVREAKELLESRKTFARMLQVDTAYHSHHMLPCTDPYISSLNASGIRPNDPSKSSCTWISSVYGSEGDPTAEELSSTYWRDNMAQAVLFSQALERAMIECGPFNAVLEVGPHPALKGPASQTLRELSDGPLPYFGLLDRKRNDIVAFGDALASLWLHFGPSAVDFEGYATASGPEGLSPPKLVKDLPSYPWDHAQIYWRESRLSREFRTRNSPPHELLGHPLPGGSYEDGLRWRNILRIEEVPWIGDHRFQGQVLVPTSAFCCMAVDAALKLPAGFAHPVTDCIELQDLIIHNAVSIPDGSQGVEIITSIHRLDIGDHPLEAEFTVLFGPPDGSKGLKKAASARVLLLHTDPTDNPAPIQAREKSLDSVDLPQFYQSLGKMGLQYTGSFTSLERIQRKWHRASALFNKETANIKHLTLDPLLVEGCIQTAYAAFSAPGDTSLRPVFLPQKIEKLSLRRSSVSRSDSWLLVDSFVTRVDKTTANTSSAFHADVEVSDSVSGQLLIELEGVTISSFIPTSVTDDRELFLQTVWKPDVSKGFSVDNEQQRKIANQAALDMEHQAILYLESLLANNVRFSGGSSQAFEWLLRLDSLSYPKGQQHTDSAQDLSHLESFETLRAVAKHLPEIIRGRLPDADLERQLQRFVETNSVFTQVKLGLHTLIGQIAHRFAHLNVLEIASGHLDPSINVLDDLAQAISSYTFVTSSPSKNVEKYGNKFKHIAVEALHSDPSAIASALDGQQFDVVIASYFLNGQTVSFSEEALRHIRKSLKAGGYLVLAEPTQEYVWSRIFLGVLLGSASSTINGRDIGHPVSSVSLDRLLRNVGFSGVDSLLPKYANGPGDAISLFVTQALDETIDLLRHPLQPSALGILDGRRVLVVGGRTLQTSRLWHNITSVLRPWTKEVHCVNSFETLRNEDTTDVAGAIVLTDLDEPVSRLLTPKSYMAISGLFEQVPHVLWVTHDALEANPEQAASISFGQSLAQGHPSALAQFLNLDTVEESEYRILGSFMRLLIPGVHDSQETRLWTTETEISVKDGCVFIPRVFPIQDLNDRLNSHWRPIIQSVDTRKDAISLSSSGFLHAATYTAQRLRSSNTVDGRPVLRTAQSIPVAINVSNGVYLYLSVGEVDNVGKVLAFTDVLSSHAPALATWKVPSLVESGPVELSNLLQLTAHVLVAQHILDSLPAGNSVLLEPSTTLATIINELAKGAEKKVHFLTTTAHQGTSSITWATIPAHASKRSLLSALPHSPKLFFDLSSKPNRMASRIVQLLPVDCALVDQRELFQLNSEGAEEVSTPWLQHVLQTIVSSAVKFSRKATHSSSPPLKLSELLEQGSRIINTVTVVDWTQKTNIPVTVAPLEPASFFFPVKTYVLVDIEQHLTQSIADWLIAHGVRSLIIINS
jgi:acyl transferase domain-containing protein/SAM-dependent methyltransferase